MVAISWDKNIQSLPQDNVTHDTFLLALCFLHSASKEIKGETNTSKIRSFPTTPTAPPCSQVQSFLVG